MSDAHASAVVTVAATESAEAAANASFGVRKTAFLAVNTVE
jgi:hypothetical protein